MDSIDIQQQIKEALIGLISSPNKSYHKARIEMNAIDWLKHQQEIISQQQEEINRLKQENTEWKRTYDRLLQGIHE